MEFDPKLEKIVNDQPYPVLFATISGAHLYGFASPDSDFDLRGVHILPLRIIAGLNITNETLEDSRIIDGLDMDIVTHDLKKFCGLMLKKNGYVLEQLFSPLIVRTSEEHQTLKNIALYQPSGEGMITRYHARHYLGFADTQWKLFQNENPRRIKPLLYVYRVLLTGLWLMKTGLIEANLCRLNESFRLSFISELIQKKSTGNENEVFQENDMLHYTKEFERLKRELEDSIEKSFLPEAPTEKTRKKMNDFLVDTRMKWGGERS